jgi:signal transduction histidine kinase
MVMPTRLRYQVTLGVTISFAVIVSLFAFLILKVTSASTEVISAERLKMAQATAAAIDASVGHTVAQLVELSSLDVVRRAAAGAPERQRLERAYRLVGGFAELALLDAAGRTVWQHSYLPGRPAVEYRKEPFVRAALATAASRVSLLDISAYDHPPVVAIAVPVRDGDTVVGVMVGLLHFAHGWRHSLVPLPAGDRNFVAAVVDGGGRILAMAGERERTEGGADSGESIGVDPHAALLRPLFEGRRPGVVIHSGATEAHLVAFAPLERLPVGVVIEEQRDVALAVPQRLQRMLVSLGVGVLMLTAVAAWAHARFVTHPLESLAQAMRQIAAGALDVPVTVSRRDEIGTLARSFETMRVGLKRAMQERDRWEQELEARVRDRTDEVRRLLVKIIHAQEEERRRLSRELHDETAQAVATLLLHLATARRMLLAGQDAVGLLDRVQTQGIRTLGELRRIIADLRPTALDDLGLIPALHDYAEALLIPAGVTPALRVSGTPRRFSSPIETAVFRILQEAISNVAKHAGARAASVEIEFAPMRLVAAVRDDGCGFEVGRRGVGLEGMRERAELIHARLEIASQPGAGTVVRLEVPDEAPDG